MPWKKGESGNPKGRPPGLIHQEFFEEIMRDHRVDLLNIAITKARSGKSPIILKFLLERFIPKVALSPLEYEKLELECEKLRKENAILNEAPELLEILKEDPIIKDKLKERLKRRTFNGKTNEIPIGATKDTAAEESGVGGY
jgi:hypothetical protein